MFPLARVPFSFWYRLFEPQPCEPKPPPPSPRLRPSCLRPRPLRGPGGGGAPRLRPRRAQRHGRAQGRGPRSVRLISGVWMCVMLKGDQKGSHVFFADPLIFKSESCFGTSNSGHFSTKRFGCCFVDSCSSPWSFLYSGSTKTASKPFPK